MVVAGFGHMKELSKNANHKSISENIEKQMAAAIYKKKHFLGSLTPLMVDKICIEVAAKNKIKIKKQSGGFAGLMSHFKNHIDFVEVCQSNISPDGWYPSPNWRRHFCRKFNLSYTSNKAKTYFSKEQLLNQLVPSLETVYTLRKVFDIPPCQGRVINLDETMFYLAKPSKRAWT